MSQDGEPFGQRLRDEQAVERIAVIPPHRKRFQSEQVFIADRQDLHAVLACHLPNIGDGGAEPVKTSQAHVDDDLPKRGDAQDKLVGLIAQDFDGGARASRIAEELPEERVRVDEDPQKRLAERSASSSNIC